MNKLVEFPDRENKLEILIKQAEKNQDRSRLKYLLKQKYELKQDKETNIRLVKLLFSEEEYVDCLDYINEFEDVYIKDEHLAVIYLESLLKESDFEKANLLIEQKFYQLDNISELKELYNDQIDEYINRLDNEKETIFKALYSLSHFSTEEQIHYASKSSLLTKEQLLDVSRLIFRNPYITPIAKTAFIESMIQHKMNDVIEYLFFDELFTVDLSKLKSFYEDSMIHLILNKIHNDFSDNPSLIEMISNEVQYDLMILYPLQSQVVENIEDWLAYYYETYSTHFTDSIRKDLNQYNYYKKIQQYKNK